MNQPVQNKFDDLKIVDIRINEPALLPAKYFFRQSVVDALYKEVRRDVLSHHEPTPAGCEPVMAQQTIVPSRRAIMGSIEAVKMEHSRTIIMACAAGVALLALIITVIVRSF